jgi:hypothetical protein
MFWSPRPIKLEYHRNATRAVESLERTAVWEAGEGSGRISVHVR